MLMVRPGLRVRQGPIDSKLGTSGRVLIEGCGKLGKTIFAGGPLQFRRHGYNGGVSFNVRDFQPADFDTLWRIDQTCFAAGISYSRTELRLYMRRRGAFTLVAVGGVPGAIGADSGKAGKAIPAGFSAEGGVAGFIVGEAGARARGHIITIDVIAEARRFGVGSLLLRAAEDRLISGGCRLVELETAVDNISALSFYKRHKYSVTRTYPAYYSNGVDALVLEKTLV